MPTRRQIRMRRIAWAIGVFVVFGLAAGVWSAYVSIRMADHAERGLHACILATDVLEAYVSTTGGSWPASWDDMQSTVPSFESHTMYSWPDDRLKLQRFVAIDFAARPEKLAAASADDFHAIKPIGSCFSSYGREFPFLIDALRRTHCVNPAERNPGAPPESN
jgi:hypothetical protein